MAEESNNCPLLSPVDNIILISGKTLPLAAPLFSQDEPSISLAGGTVQPPFRQLILRSQFPVRLWAEGGRARQQLWCGVVCSAMGWCGTVWCGAVWCACTLRAQSGPDTVTAQSSVDQP